MAIKNKKQKLFESDWIVKTNALNEIRDNRMSPSQIRFFSIYLSKINPRKPESRLVTFELKEYTRIMQFKQTNITRLQKTAHDLLGLTATFKEPDGGLTICQLFKRFKLFKDVDDEWYVSIDCHDDMLPYMFEFKGYYFKYQLWNALKLTSPNQQRMYEILKQYEHAGAREISVKDLREFLGLEPTEYDRWQNFKVRILDSSQQALRDFTDIKFTWEPVGKRGKGGKIQKLAFTIEKNSDFVSQLTLEDYIQEQRPSELEDEPEPFEFVNEQLAFLAGACNNEFKEDEVRVLFNLIVQRLPLDGDQQATDLKRYNYLKSKFDEMHMRKPKTNRFGYLRKLIEADLKGDNS